MKSAFALVPLVFAITNVARGDTFGSGVATFSIEFVTIGNPNNVADTKGDPNPGGSVGYTYQIGKYEISEQMIDKANALSGLGITKNTRGANKPATQVSWNESAGFVNWLNTSAGRVPAYKFELQPGDMGYNANDNDIQVWSPGDAGYAPNNIYRNSLATYFLPSLDEWYKAAYYDPVNGVYYRFATGSDTTPTAVSSGVAAGTAVYDDKSTVPADIMIAGGLSPYGTMAQSGNVAELQETDLNRVNGPTPTGARTFRGGNWESSAGVLPISLRNGINPPTSFSTLGFRVARVDVQSQGPQT